MKEKTCRHNKCILGYRINLYFHDYKLAIEIDENDHSDRKIDYEIQRLKAIEQELGCEFIRTDPDREDLLKISQWNIRHIRRSCNRLTKKVWWIKFQ